MSAKIMSYTLALVLAAGLPACDDEQEYVSNDPISCGEGDAFSFNGEDFCLYKGPIIEEGFQCPPELARMHSFGDFIACAQSDIPPGFESSVRERPDYQEPQNNAVGAEMGYCSEDGEVEGAPCSSHSDCSEGLFCWAATKRFIRNVQAIENASLCMGDNGLLKLHFIMSDQNGDVIRPGDRLESVTVDASTLNESNFAVSSGRLFPVTPKALVRCASSCETDLDCEEDIGSSCIRGFCLENPDQEPDAACQPAGLDVCRPYDTQVDDLGSSFQISELNTLSFCRSSCNRDEECNGGLCVESANGNYCSVKAHGGFCEVDSECLSGFTCQPLPLDAENRRSCTLDAALETSGPLAFVNPQPDRTNNKPIAVALVMDNSGSLFGRGVVESDRTVRVERATDPTEFRLTAARTFLLDLRRRQFAQNAVVSAWSFRGESELGVTPLFGDITSIPPNPYTESFGQASPTQTPDQVAISDLSREGDFGRSPVYEAVRVVSQNIIDLGISDRHTPFVVLFTDGPDDTAIINEEANEAQREAALQSWRQRLEEAASVVQEAGARLFIVHLDTGLSEDGVAALSPDPRNAVVYGRDSKGRVGPLEEYAQLACQTGGHYLYVTDPSTLTTTFDTLVDLIGGTWELNLAVNTPGQTLPNGAYQLGMDVSVSLDGRTETHSHDLGAGSSFSGENDNRIIIFKSN